MASSAEIPNEYFAGLIDAQLKVTLAKTADTTRVTLTSADPRVADRIAEKFEPTRTTIVKRPGKKDTCTILFVGKDAKPVLEFAAEECILKKDVAAKTLEYLAGDATTVDPSAPEEVEEVSVDWAAGFFDARGEVLAPAPSKKRGVVRLPLPKAERFIIPALKKVLHGKCRKENPTRLVYDTKESLTEFLEAVNGHVHVKSSDLETVM